MTVKFKPGDRVRAWGIVGGPFPGRVVRKGVSKDCWIVRVRVNEHGTQLKELNEDYLRKREAT